MTNLVPVTRALLSVSDKTDLVPFARQLAGLGVEIVSTGGTARALREAGLDVIPIDAVTGFPEMMDGRVKTLHPAVHGALLGRRDVPAHVEAMAAHGIVPIDLVCISLYPFEQTIRREDVTAEEAIEQIDIGGPAMIRSAAKNHASVAVVTSASQYDRVITELQANDGATTLELRRDLAALAFTRTAEYDTSISAWMSSRREEAFPGLLRLSYAHQAELRYGENPHQRAALYANPASAEPSVVSAERLWGKPLSYNNLRDAAAALELVQDLADVHAGKAAAVVLKHTNPCGAAVRETLDDAFDAAYAGDPLAAFGGVLALSQRVDTGVAAHITEGQKFLEVIVAPGFTDEAVAALGERWKNVRLLAVRGLAHTGHRKINYVSVPGGMLVQERDMRIAKPDDWQHACGPEPSDELLESAAFAWMTVKRPDRRDRPGDRGLRRVLPVQRRPPDPDRRRRQVHRPAGRIQEGSGNAGPLRRARRDAAADRRAPLPALTPPAHGVQRGGPRRG
jgi:phosphoribosylaminoimidazolecarboxamide formyltransferase/IMP cyclohydrolase